MKELLTFILICLGVFGLIFFLAWTFSQVEISVDEYRLLHNQMKQFPELQVEIKKAFEDGRITSYEFEIIEDQYNQCMKKQALYNDRLRSIRRQNKQVISYSVTRRLCICDLCYQSGKIVAYTNDNLTYNFPFLGIENYYCYKCFWKLQQEKRRKKIIDLDAIKFTKKLSQNQQIIPTNAYLILHKHLEGPLIHCMDCKNIATEASYACFMSTNFDFFELISIVKDKFITLSTSKGHFINRGQYCPKCFKEYVDRVKKIKQKTIVWQLD